MASGSNTAGEEEGRDGQKDREFLPERLRRSLLIRLNFVLSPLAGGLIALGVKATHITLMAFVLSLCAAGSVVAGGFALAGILYLASGMLDLMDGTLARRAGTVSRFGAFLDSSLDRASEGFLFAAIGYHFAMQGAAFNSAMVVLALLGSVLVSYTRSRVEGLGGECKEGIATRGERIVLVSAGLLTGWLVPALYLLVVLTAVTVLQRMLQAYRVLR